MPVVVALESALPWHPDPYCVDRAQIEDVVIIGIAPTAVVRLKNGQGILVTRRAVFAAGLDRLAV